MYLEIKINHHDKKIIIIKKNEVKYAYTSMYYLLLKIKFSFLSLINMNNFFMIY